MGKLMFNGVNYTGGGGSGATQLSQLSDVNLNNLQDGQTIKYDYMNHEWVNADAETTGSDIAVSDSDATSIAEAISAINSFMATTLVNGTLDPTYATSGNIVCMKKGGCLTIRLDGVQLTTISGRVVIGTVPEGYRPRMQAVGFIDASTIACGVNIDGTVWVDAGASGKKVWGGVTTVQGF